MGKRGKRIRLATNIYADRYSITIRAKGQDGGRYPLGTPLAELIRYQKDFARDLKAPAKTPRGTLAADIPIYLATITNPRKLKDDTARLAHWARTPLANLPRQAITSAQIKAELSNFVNKPQPRRARKPGTTPAPKPLSIETANKLLTVLRSLYRELNTDTDPNPAARVKKLAVDDQPPRDLGYDVADEILAAIPDRGRAAKGEKRPTINLTKIRLALMAGTSWPPAVIMRIKPDEDIIWRPKIFVRIRRRRKGKGVEERWLPLTPRGEQALRDFVKARADGPFSTSSVYKTWQVACDKVRERRPDLPHCSPYALRHTFITHTRRQSRNDAGTAYVAVLGNPSQLKRYGAAAIPELAAQAIQAAGEPQKGATAPAKKRKKTQRSAKKPLRIVPRKRSA